MTAPGADAALEIAFRKARYGVECPGGQITRHIDRIDPAADAALATAGCRARWAILTPCNPGAVALDGAGNEARLAALREQLDAAGLRYLPSVNHAVDGGWPEPGFCILDAEPALIDQLARQYGQLACVGARLGEAPALLWTMELRSTR